MRWPENVGRWRVGELIGSGGTAEVRLGSDGAHRVALKKPARGDELDAQLLAIEAQIIARVQHPNVVRFVEMVDGVLVLERMSGCTIGELVGRGVRFSTDVTLSIVAQAAAGLAAAHAAVDVHGDSLEVVHRDVAPDNLFATTDGAVKLFDFNVAFQRGHTSAPAAGAMQGRVAYMAPEQARGEPHDASADVFALGVVLWELLVGQRLFWRGNQLATLRAVVDELAPRIRIEPHVDALVARMLSHEVGERPSSHEVATVLSASPEAVAQLAAIVTR